MTHDELTKIVRLHGMWLRNDPGAVMADLSWANLRGADLRWADLRWANLRGADLSGATFAVGWVITRKEQTK